MTTPFSGRLRCGSSTDMRTLDITQDSVESSLRLPSTDFGLPAEAAEARRTIAKLRQRAAQVREIHTFRTGMGLAAPQIGIHRRAAIIYLAEQDDVITLLNPRIQEQSTAVETRFEGCLSFFDVRGQVARPVHLLIAHQRLDGTQVTSAFEGSVARLVAHEIDHLNGVLYTQRMAAGDRPIPVEHYRRTAYEVTTADASGSRGTTPGSVGSSR
ncbi:peptide deformylase [Cryptosporangium sp. NPDC048952]|uniref:peptide deformylase n=1 Tax=Cryptosporangium sp. NPDC048952 TaxID=3363961 RepID=UPI003711E58B